jgi:protein tyrosine phosphatase (PTP) superfamily phosphohydrolase (DUF442 family)
MTSFSEPTRRKIRLPAIVGLAVVLAAAGFGSYWAFFQTYHLATVAPGVLYRTGNHSIRELRHAVEDVKPRTVVSLIDPKEASDPAKPQFKEEEQYLAGQNIKLIRIPVTLGGWPDSREVQAFLKTVADPANRPVLVHCAQGVRRTGMFVAAYQLSVEKLDKEQAKAAVLSFGHSGATLGDIRKFIDAYDPQKEELSASLTDLKPAGATDGF